MPRSRVQAVHARTSTKQADQVQDQSEGALCVDVHHASARGHPALILAEWG